MSKASIEARVERRFLPAKLSAAVARVFGQRLPVLEERVYRKDGRRVACTLARVHA